MNRKGWWLLGTVFLTLAFFAQGFLFAQDYWRDDQGQYHQRIRWIDIDARYYDVELEKRDNVGEWLPQSRGRTESIYLELSLSPGVYRFRVYAYDSFNRPIGISEWTDLRVYEAKAPQAEPLAARKKILRDDPTFTLTIAGEDLVDGAELYLISTKKDASPIKPLALEYSFDESWIRAEFPVDAIERGDYTLVITNPGGMDQILDKVALRPVRSAGAFDLDNTKSWSLGGGGHLTIYPPFFKSEDSGIGLGGGAQLRYTYYERYRDYGTFFLVPNSWFVDAAVGYTNMADHYPNGHGIGGNNYPREVMYSSLRLGFLYRFRLGEAQRLLFNTGFSFGLAVGTQHETEENNPGWESNDPILGLMTTIHTGFSYRFTPQWSADLGVDFGGTAVMFTKDKGFGGFFVTLGVTYRKPYGQGEEEQKTPPPPTGGPFDLSNHRYWDIGLEGAAVYWPGAEWNSFPMTSSWYLRYTFHERYGTYGTPFFLPNVFFIDGGFSMYGTDWANTFQGRANLGLMYRFRLGSSQRFLFSTGVSAGPMVARYVPKDSFGGDEVETEITINGDIHIAELSFRINPAWSMEFGMGFTGPIPYILGYDIIAVGGFEARLGVSYRRQK